MNTMKGFYDSISSVSHLHGSYLEALSEITQLSYQQVKAIRSNMTWQDWSPQDRMLGTPEI